MDSCIALELVGNSLTPFEADQEAIAEFNEWFDIYYSVDRFMFE